MGRIVPYRERRIEIGCAEFSKILSISIRGERMKEHDKKWYEHREYIIDRIRGQWGYENMPGLHLLPTITLQTMCEEICEWYIAAGNTPTAEEWNAIVETCKMAIYLEEEHGHPYDRNDSYRNLPSWIIDTIKG